MLKKMLLSGVLTAGLLFTAQTAFAATPTVTSAKITGPNTVTIYFSEPVITSVNNYSDLTGSLSGRNVTAISGSGTNQVKLTVDGSQMTSNATGQLYINTQTVSVSDGSPFQSGYVNVTDGQPPTISSFSVASTNTNGSFLGYPSTITMVFNLNESVLTPNISIGGYSVSIGGSGSGPYTATYTMNGSETTPLGVTATFTDLAGNASQLSLSLGSSVNANQLLSSITSDATSVGMLKVGDTITFTLTPSSPQPGATVSGAYNGRLLTWTTNNGGESFTATYTVQTGDPNQGTPLQISGVTITTPNGLTSAPIAGTDVEKTIATQGPVLTSTSVMPSVVSTAYPSFSFTSNGAGTVVYYGNCNGAAAQAMFGANTVVMGPLANGTYYNCLVGVRDSAGNMSNLLPIGTFTVSASGNTTQPTTSQTTTTTTTSNTTATSCSSKYKFYNPLDVGSTGTDVTQLQERLTDEGYYSGPVTGYYGPLTQAGVERYQAAHGLDQLGNVGPGTRNALNNCL